MGRHGHIPIGREPRANRFRLHTVCCGLLFLAGFMNFPAQESRPATKENKPMNLQLTSSAFPEGQPIPQKYTCQGSDVSPPLKWTKGPANTKSFALIADDPDAPDPKAPKMTWVHWVLHNLPATACALPEGMNLEALPVGTKEGWNDWKRIGYGGPCPPIGRHRYFHKLYALDTA